MGLFNVIKGAYPSLQQIDLTLDMASGETGIVRGSCLYIDSGEFKLAGAAQAGSSTGTVITPGAFLYYSLMDQDNLVAGMAGTIGQGFSGGVPRLTGIACSMPGEFETDQFTGTPALDEFLTIGADGKLVVLTPATGQTAYGQVTRALTTRWDNAATAIDGWRTGNKVNVIRFRSMYVPGLKTA